MTMAEKQLLTDQMKLIERTRKAAQFHHELAELCDKANLPILAREHDHAAKQMTGAVDLQIRAFRDQALA
jgi:hypothetical protein